MPDKGSPPTDCWILSAWTREAASAWNFCYADDAPEKKEITREFFDLVFKGVYDIYISEVVIKEIRGASELKRKKLFELIEKCSPAELKITKESEELAERYIDKKIVPAGKWEDALHVGIATVEEMLWSPGIINI